MRACRQAPASPARPRPGDFGLRARNEGFSIVVQTTCFRRSNMLLLNSLGGLRRWSAQRCSGGKYRPAHCRPRVEALEDRLPPGDAVLGGLLAWSWLEPTLSFRHTGFLPFPSQLTVGSAASFHVPSFDRELSAPSRGAAPHVGTPANPDIRGASPARNEGNRIHGDSWMGQAPTSSRR